jgi:hypothetical protein
VGELAASQAADPLCENREREEGGREAIDYLE